MRIKVILARVRAAVIRWELLRVEAQQRKVIEVLVDAVDYRLYAQRYFEDHSKINAARREALQLKLDALTKEMA